MFLSKKAKALRGPAAQFLVGVNNYQERKGYPSCDLAGCVRDVQIGRDLYFKHTGINDYRTFELYDKKATAANYIARLEKACQATLPGQVLIIRKSAHGSQRADKNGDEADGKDEFFCTTDVLHGKGILDDKFQEILVKNLPFDAGVLIIVDTCHSGSATRADVGFPRAKAIDSEALGINWAMPKTIQVREETRHPNQIAFTSCQDSQVSWEVSVGGTARGLFTWAIDHFVGDMFNGTDPKEILKATAEKMKSISTPKDQTPNLWVSPGCDLDLFKV